MKGAWRTLIASLRVLPKRKPKPSNRKQVDLFLAEFPAFFARNKQNPQRPTALVRIIQLGNKSHTIINLLNTIFYQKRLKLVEYFEKLNFTIVWF